MSLKVDLRTEASSLKADDNGRLKLLLFQAASDFPVVGIREALKSGQAPTVPTLEQIAECGEILQQSEAASLMVMSYHPGLADNESKLVNLANDRTIVGLRGIDRDRKNTTYIGTTAALHSQAKLSFSSEDIELNVVRGERLTVFSPSQGSDAITWAVLNCHDYTHVELMRLLQKHSIEILVVVTYNPATKLYWEYAKSDIHRLFCFVVIANIAELGGSGVFAPFRRIGRDKNAQIGAAGQVFGASGIGEFRVTIPLDIAELRRLRNEFREHGFGAKSIQSERKGHYVAVVPSEHFMHTFDRAAGAPPISADDVYDIDSDWNFKRPRVAIAQLHHIGLEAYISTKYRIRHDSSCGDFELLLSTRLLELEYRCRHLGKTCADSLLDMLVFPEVFIPRSFIGTLQGFSDRNRTTIVAGVDYPDGGEESNANECVIIRPNLEPSYYRKVTRSQYDAIGDNRSCMPMRRGTRLIRFVNADGRGYGVLICYDYSHFDLLYELNLARREQPLDVLVVVAHNPFATSIARVASPTRTVSTSTS